MAVDWSNVGEWEAGEIALLSIIMVLFGILFILLVCIVYYWRIYINLKRIEGKPLYQSDGVGDGPFNATTVRPHYHAETTEDEDDEEDDDEEEEDEIDDVMDEEHNINFSNKHIRKYKD